MADRPDENGTGEESSFAKRAGQDRPSLLRDYWWFLRSEKKWWYLPILILLLGAGGFAILAVSPAAPFLYTLF